MTGAAQSTHLLHVDGLHELLARAVLHVELKDSVGLHRSASLREGAWRTHLLLEVLLLLVRHRREAVGNLLEVLVRLELAHFAIVVGREEDLPRAASILAQHSVPVKVWPRLGDRWAHSPIIFCQTSTAAAKLTNTAPAAGFRPGPDFWLMRGSAEVMWLRLGGASCRCAGTLASYTGTERNVYRRTTIRANECSAVQVQWSKEWTLVLDKCLCIAAK